MTEFILEAKDLVFNYPGDTLALNGISVKIPKGEKTVFLGGNGAGKTTLFLHFNGVLKPHKGKVYFKNEELKYDQKSLNALRKCVGIVFQDPDTQLFSTSVCQEISFGPINLGFPEDKVRRYVDYALQATGTVDLKDKPTQFLSYGEKRKVTIASIIAMVPEVIIFDEPTNYIDPKHKIQIMNFLTDLNKSGITIILSTHNVDIAYSWADNVIVMQDGLLLKEGKPDEIFSNIEVLKSANLTEPIILEIFNELKLSKLIKNDTPLPKDKEELINIIRSNA